MARSIISFLVILVCLDDVNGYPNGAPPSVCNSMAPAVAALPYGHGAQPQPSSAPYNVAINVPAEGATTGNNYTVTVTANANTTFKGFMCQVRKDGTSDIVGSFTSFDIAKAKNVKCAGNDKAAVTHTYTSVFTFSNFNATWQAPDSVSGDYQLTVYCTIVEVRATYWVKVRSSTFTLKPPTAPSTEAPEVRVPANMTAGPTSSSAPVTRATVASTEVFTNTTGGRTSGSSTARVTRRTVPSAETTVVFINMTSGSIINRATRETVPSSYKAPEVSATMTVGPASGSSHAVGSFGIICLALLLKVLFF